MNKIVKSILVGSVLPLAMILFYLVGAFIQWDIMWLCYEEIFNNNAINCSLYPYAFRTLAVLFLGGMIISYLIDMEDYA